LKGVDAPKRPELGAAVLGCGGGKADVVSVDCRRLVFSAALLPNMLVPPVVPDASEPNPPLLAKPAKPPVDGAVDGAALGLPKILFDAPNVAKPDWPKVGVVVDVAAVPQGDVFTPTVEAAPKVEGCPKAGAAEPGVLPNELAPKTGADGFGAVGVAGLGAPHGEGFAPRAEEPPNAGAAGVDDPKIDVPAAVGVDNAGAGVGVGAGAEVSTAAIPG